VLNRFRQKFWKRTAGSAFSKWRGNCYKQVVMTFEETSEQVEAMTENHASRVGQRKENNSNQAGRFIGKSNLRNLFGGWRNIARFMKMQRIKKGTMMESLGFLDKMRAVRLWRGRLRATKLARQREARLIEKYRKMKLKLYYDALAGKYSVARIFFNRMSNLANIHDHQALKMGYNAIISFARSKGYVFQKKKEHSAKDIQGFLYNLYLRKLSGHFYDLKFRSMNKYKQNVSRVY